MLEKLETVDRPEDIWAVAEKVAFRFAPAPRTGDIVLDAKGLGASRGGRVLFEGVDLLMRRGDRIGIVGPNGSGKTTLLKLARRPGRARRPRRREARDEPRDRATSTSTSARSTRRRPRSKRSAACAAISTSTARANTSRASASTATIRSAASRASRAASAAVSRSPSSCSSRATCSSSTSRRTTSTSPPSEILEEALAGFEGTVLLVSHDRRFLEGVTTRTLAVKENGVDVYPGGFADYATSPRDPRRSPQERAVAEAERRARRSGAQRGPRKARAVKTKRLDEASGAHADASPARRSAPSKRTSRRARAFERKKKRVKELEVEIAKGEAELARCAKS